jgi:hypothetical protein
MGDASIEADYRMGRKAGEDFLSHLLIHAGETIA